MQSRKLSLAIATFPYGGNGGVSSEAPTVRNWLMKTWQQAAADERIEKCAVRDFSDTPITMTRNAAVEWAQQEKFDLLLMIDSDMAPDCEADDPEAKEFWASSFDYLYEHYERGPIVIGAPYCGPPPAENVYIFLWRNQRSNNPNPDWQLGQYTREHAAIMAGIQECAALPTGLILFDVRVFDVVTKPYFTYEYHGDGAKCSKCGETEPGPQSRKASTEDVVTTRNISLCGLAKLGYNPMLANWDAWAGHWKPICVKKPRTVKIDAISKVYTKATLEGVRSDQKLINLGPAVPANRFDKPNGKQHDMAALLPARGQTLDGLDAKAIAKEVSARMGYGPITVREDPKTEARVKELLENAVETIPFSEVDND